MECGKTKPNLRETVGLCSLLNKNWSSLWWRAAWWSAGGAVGRQRSGCLGAWLSFPSCWVPERLQHYHFSSLLSFLCLGILSGTRLALSVLAWSGQREWWHGHYKTTAVTNSGSFLSKLIISIRVLILEECHYIYICIYKIIYILYNKYHILYSTEYLLFYVIFI